MHYKISSWLMKISSKKLTIVGFILFLVFSIAFLPSQSRIAEKYSQGMGSPDTSLFYTSADLFRMAEFYGEEGRSAYINARWTFDLAFPLIYTFFLVTSISWFSKHVLPVESDFRTGNIIPLYAMLFDLLENSAATLVLRSYPQQNTLLAALAPFFTLVKWIYVAVSFLLLFVFMVWFIIKRIRKKASTISTR